VSATSPQHILVWHINVLIKEYLYFKCYWSKSNCKKNS